MLNLSFSKGLFNWPVLVEPSDYCLHSLRLVDFYSTSPSNLLDSSCIMKIGGAIMLHVFQNKQFGGFES